MNFPTVLKPFVYIFYIIGLSPYPFSSVIKNKLNKTVLPYYFPMIIGFCLNFLPSIYIFHVIKYIYTTKLYNIQVIMSCILSLITIFVNCIAYIQCFLNRRSLCDTIQLLCKMELYFQFNFNKNLCFHNLTRQLWLKFFLLLGLQFCSLTTTILSPKFSYTQTEYVADFYIVSNIMDFVTCINCLHVILYASILHVCLMELQNVLNEYLAGCMNLISLTIEQENKFKNIKTNYMSLRNIGHNINEYFGWNVVLVLNKLFVDITYYVYAVYLVCQRWQLEATISIIRK